MKYLMILLLMCVLSVSCENIENYFIYSSFDSKGNVLNESECVFSYQEIDKKIINWKVKAQRGYSKNLIIKEDSNGVYWKCKDSFYLMIPYKLEESEDYCMFYSPVIQQHYHKHDIKLVNLKENKVEVIRYYGVSGSHIGSTMYYIKGIGVLAICLTDKTYWLCTETNHAKLNREDLSVLRNYLLNDTSFFSIKNE